MIYRILAILLLSGYGVAVAQTAEEIVIQETNVEELMRFSNELEQLYEADYQAALKAAKLNNWPLEIVDPTGYAKLMGLYPDGSPRYEEVTNRNAARTISTDDVHLNGGAGLNLEGQNMTLGEWDGGGVLLNHVEFNGRVQQRDNSSSTHYHATHVAGTLVASGVNARAKGMAPKAKLWAYDWNQDASEMSAAAGNGLLVSNHSYGTRAGWSSSNGTWYWYGNTAISSTEDWQFGFYDNRASQWDRMARLAPYYLIVKAAGNDRNDQRTGSHQVRVNGRWTTSTARRDPDGQYDCLPTYSTAKNILTVGAVNDIVAGYRSSRDVVMTSFSGWGPTDDGRIKPDIVGNGRSVYSTNNTGTSSYFNSDGTSMAAPNVAGSCILLQQHYNATHSRFMRSATLKGLVIHTADEAGNFEGPDYTFGWGLMNTRKAAEAITSSKVIIEENRLNNRAVYEKNVSSDGRTPVKITICWTDIEGTPTAASLDPTKLMLVNDLDVRLINTTTGVNYSPYKLNPLTPASAATKGDNTRDNVEKIYYSSVPAGNYKIRVSHKGNLSGGRQDYSIIYEGFSNGITASFNTSDTIVCVGDTVYYENTTIAKTTATQWSFQGGHISVSTVAKPYVVYNTVGTFITQLTVQAGTVSDATTRQVKVVALPDAGVLEKDTAYCKSETGGVLLTPKVTGGKWNGLPWMIYVDSCKFIPNKLQAGKYKAAHTVVSIEGCIKTDSIEVEIVNNPQVSLQFETEKVCNTHAPFALNGGNPSGGTYSIQGTNYTQFDPSAFVATFHQVDYEYTDTNGCSGMASKFIEVRNCVGIDEAAVSGRNMVFPNPVSGVLSIKHETTVIPEIKVLNQEGRLVYVPMQSFNGTTQLDFESLPGGVYFIRLLAEDYTENHKVIKY